MRKMILICAVASAILIGIVAYSLTTGVSTFGPGRYRTEDTSYAYAQRSGDPFMFWLITSIWILMAALSLWATIQIPLKYGRYMKAVKLQIKNTQQVAAGNDR